VGNADWLHHRSADVRIAWWLGGLFVHEVGAGAVVFNVVVCGAPGYLAGMVGDIEEWVE
jgi:hypothetical protein